MKMPVTLLHYEMLEMTLGKAIAALFYTPIRMVKTGAHRG